MKMAEILTAENVNFLNLIKYPEIRIQKEKVTFICGESGCGKSTLLKLFNGTLSPAKGTIYYGGKSIEEIDSVLLRREVMLVSQTVFLFDGTIEESFMAYYNYREIPVISKEKMQKFLLLCCADFNLETRCETMSGGQRQRVFMAICLSFLPKVILLDEPTAALDEDTAKSFLKNLKGFCAENKIALVIVSHDRSLAQQFADMVINLGKGAER